MPKEIKFSIKLPDPRSIFRKSFMKARRLIKKKLIRSLIRFFEAKKEMAVERRKTLAVLAVQAVFWIVFSFEAGFFWAVFCAFFLFRWDSRVPAAFALLFLAVTPFMLVLKLETAAETAAIYAYYFLIITVVLQIAEYRRNPEEFEEGSARRIVRKIARAGHVLDLKRR